MIQTILRPTIDNRFPALEFSNPQKEDTDDLIAKAAEIEEECAADQPDLGTDLLDHRRRYEIDELIRVQKEANDVHQMRLNYAKYIFWLVLAWLGMVALAVLWTGFGGVNDRVFFLSDKVLIAFISSTTINVIGLFVVVAKWMYPSGGSSTSNHKPDEAGKSQFTISLAEKKD